MDLDTRFNDANALLKTIKLKPTNWDDIILYSYYQQANHGDVEGQRPLMFDMIGRARFEAWNKLKGMTSTEAKEQYIHHIENLLSSKKVAI